MTEPDTTTLSDEDIVTTPAGRTDAGTATTADVSDTGDDTGDDSGDPGDVSDTGDDSGDDSGDAA